MKPEPKASVSDKKKFFEKAMEEHNQPSPKPERVFTFLNADEVEKLKQEEEKKIASLSRTELKALSRLEEDGDQDEPEVVQVETVKSTTTSPGIRNIDGLLSMGSIRTAKAERRMKERLIQEGLLSDDDEKDLSPAEQRARKAEKRAAWRQARLKSLEQDALQAQMVIKKMSEMIDSKNVGIEDDGDATIINNNQAIMDHENNLTPEVETRKEKIISLELSAPEAEVECDPDEPTSPTTPTSDGATSTSSRKKKRKKSKRGKH